MGCFCGLKTSHRLPGLQEMAEAEEHNWLVIIGTVVVGAIIMIAMFGGGEEGPTKGKSAQKNRLQPLS